MRGRAVLQPRAKEADEGTGPSGLGDGNPDTVADVTFTPLGAPARSGGSGKRRGSSVRGVSLFGRWGRGDGWRADPDEQFLLDVRIRQLKLGDGVRAYNTPEGTCILLGDFLTTLDVPMKIDLAAKKASGWAFKEKHRIVIDASSGAVAYEVTVRNNRTAGWHEGHGWQPVALVVDSPDYLGGVSQRVWVPAGNASRSRFCGSRTTWR